MDLTKLKQLGSSLKVSEAYTLQELIDGARHYEKLCRAYEEKEARLDAELKRIQEQKQNIIRQRNAESFGGLLLNAIGHKMSKDTNEHTTITHPR